MAVPVDQAPARIWPGARRDHPSRAGRGYCASQIHGAALSADVDLFFAAISHGSRSRVQRPLATVVGGGMFVGPSLLLVVASALRKTFLSRDAESVVVTGDPVAVTEGNPDGSYRRSEIPAAQAGIRSVTSDRLGGTGINKFAGAHDFPKFV
jgi:hypothetical protein